LKDIENSLKPGDYIAYGCYKLCRETTKKVQTLELDDQLISNILKTINPLNNISWGKDSEDG